MGSEARYIQCVYVQRARTCLTVPKDRSIHKEVSSGHAGCREDLALNCILNDVWTSVSFETFCWTNKFVFSLAYLLSRPYVAYSSQPSAHLHPTSCTPLHIRLCASFLTHTPVYKLHIRFNIYLSIRSSTSICTTIHHRLRSSLFSFLSINYIPLTIVSVLSHSGFASPPLL